MNDGLEAKQRGTTNLGERVVTERGVANRTEPADIEWVDAADLRAITPEEIQLLAATGC